MLFHFHSLRYSFKVEQIAKLDIIESNLWWFCFANRSDVVVEVSVYIGNVNASDGVLVGARIDQGGCTTFLAKGIFLILNVASNRLKLSQDLGKSSTSDWMLILFSPIACDTVEIHCGNWLDIARYSGPVHVSIG